MILCSVFAFLSPACHGSRLASVVYNDVIFHHFYSKSWAVGLRQWNLVLVKYFHIMTGALRSVWRKADKNLTICMGKGFTVYTRVTINGSIRVEAAQTTHRKEATHNGSKVRLLKWDLCHKIIFSERLRLLPFPHTEFGEPVISWTAVIIATLQFGYVSQSATFFPYFFPRFNDKRCSFCIPWHVSNVTFSICVCYMGFCPLLSFIHFTLKFLFFNFRYT